MIDHRLSRQNVKLFLREPFLRPDDEPLPILARIYAGFRAG
jgi:hypothetical protein